MCCQAWGRARRLRMPMMEFKYAPIDGDVTESGEISGYASKFGEVDDGGDIVQIGAFTKSLSRRRPKMLWAHDPAQPIGVWSEMSEDESGLRVPGKIDLSVQRAREVHSLLKSGAIDGLSIGYRTALASKNEKGQRLLKELDLWEVSLVTFPMLSSASVDAVKSDNPADIAMFKRIVESAMRDAGCSSTQAKAAAVAAAKSWFGRDVQIGDTSERLDPRDIGDIIRGFKP